MIPCIKSTWKILTAGQQIKHFPLIYKYNRSGGNQETKPRQSVPVWRRDVGNMKSPNSPTKAD